MRRGPVDTLTHKLLAAIAQPRGPVVPSVRSRIIVFTRYPMPGQAKTRLVPAIGPLPAARLQRYMSEHVLGVARAAAERTGAEVEVRITGCDERKARRWLGGGVSFGAQGQGDIGLRMERAIDDALADGRERAVLVGADCPDISADDIIAALDALNECDCVLGPSADGGYWLVGLRRPGDIFRDVEWGGPGVLARTLELAARAGVSVRQLRQLTDIDTPADLQASPLAGRFGRAKPYVSVIIPALNEAACIQSAIASVCSEDAEIIVVDGGSSDDTAAITAQAGARVISCPPGRGRQMDLGAATATGEVLLFLHADTLLPSGYVQFVFDALSDPRVPGGAFEHRTDSDSLAMAALAMTVRFRANYVHVPYGDQGIFVRRQVFDKLGGFGDLPIAEDLYFVRRMGKVGRVVVVPHVAITSSRRWRKRGVLTTTIINYLIVIGCVIGVPPALLVRIYDWAGAVRA